jgi:CheY-like chemotaxis protein/nitrogen-specific signal transduction histidine kinase
MASAVNFQEAVTRGPMPVGRGENGRNHPDTQLEAVREMKAQFLASLNHEIRTPLSGILGMTDLLMETQLDTDQVDYVRSARRCAQDLLAILNAALELSALASGTIEPEEGEFALRECLMDAVAGHHDGARDKGLVMQCTLVAGLPDVVIGDAVRIRQVLGHLLDNAVKFTQSGEVELWAAPRDRDDGGLELLLEVRDTGIGISAEVMPHIFETFRQGQGGLSRQYSGLGLGLALVQSLCRLLNGTVSVASTPGQGSTFSLRLPVRRAEVAVARQPETEKHQARILVVEDNAVAQHIVRLVLGREGHTVDCVGAGLEALAAAGRTTYDAVLMDLQMPGMDGFEATAALRKIPGYGRVPVLAFTANSADEYRSLARENGMQGFLAKPVEPRELVAAIKRCLDPQAPAWSGD